MPPAFKNGAEYHLWAERLLLRCCSLSSRFTKLNTESRSHFADPEMVLAPFRAWASLWESDSSAGLTTNAELEASSSAKRRLVWQMYYNTLSRFLQTGCTYPDSSGEGKSRRSYGEAQPSPKQRQYAELRRVEAIYESQLLKEVRFPQASESNLEVVQWVDQVMSNWSIYCGPMWCDEDVGSDGQEGASRKVLDVRICVTSNIQIFRKTMNTEANSSSTDPVPRGI